MPKASRPHARENPGCEKLVFAAVAARADFKRAASTRKETNEMSIMSRFPDKYLKGHDIEVGEVVTITHVTDERVGKDQEAQACSLYRRVRPRHHPE